MRLLNFACAGRSVKLLIIAVVFTAGSINAGKIYAEEFPFRIVTAEEAPYQYEANGRQWGYSIDTLSTMLEHANLNTRIEFLQWPEAYSLAKNQKNVMIFSMVRTVERDKHFLWVCPLYKIKFKLYKLKKSYVEIQTLDDAKKYTTAVWQEDVQHQYLRSKGFSRLVVANFEKTLIEFLLSERVTLIPFNQESLKWQMEKAGLGFNLVEPVLDLTEMESRAYIAFNKDSDPLIVEKIVKSYNIVKETNFFKKIYNMHDE